MGATKEEAAATRQRLLSMATELLRTRGVNGLTLDLVAKEAGISKGGLLHHFPTKLALLEYVLRRMIDDFEARVQSHYDKLPPQPGRWLRAYIFATFNETDEHPVFPLEVAALLFTAISEHPSLQSLLHTDMQHWHERLMNDGIAPGRALLIRHAADAHWMEQVLASQPIDPSLRQALIDELLQLTEVPAS